LGGDPEEPSALALPLRRAGHGTTGCRSRAHLSRSLLERVLGHAQPQFAAFDQDAKDNQAFLAAGKLAMPVLAVGGEKSFGKTMAEIMRFAASDVREGAIPDSGHWIMEENPAATIELVRGFLDAA
jgi:pimeloyl-ACP methyl ester carboxylesterase